MPLPKYCTMPASHRPCRRPATSVAVGRSYFDFDHVREETDIVGFPIQPLVHQLVAMWGEAGRHVHWG
ncbi:hypothetical protein [Cupriavidus sp. CP313]